MKLFDDSIKEAVLQAAKNHTDVVGNRDEKIMRAKFDNAIRQRDRLRKAKKRYIELERAFRAKYRLPMHEVLNKN